MKPWIFFCFLALVCTRSLSAQPAPRQQFGAFGYLGVNRSQIDGDAYEGYRKYGVRGGLGVNILLSPLIYTSVGFGFSQFGSRASQNEQAEQARTAINLTLNTVEVPVMVHFRIGDRRATTKKYNFGLYESPELHVGVAVNRTTGRRVKIDGNLIRLTGRQNFVSVLDEYKDWDLHFLFGGSIQLSLSTGLFFNHSLSVLGLYQPETIGPEDVLGLKPYYYTVGVRYTLY